MTNLPRRVYAHETDTEACKIVSMKLGKDWEIRDLTGRDFGIDKIIERFEDGVATSEIMMLQIKGTTQKIDYRNPKFSLDTKTLLYAEMFSSPFILVYCSTTTPDQCYYVWLQEYIRIRLNFEKPNWRNQKSNTIYFPLDNILGTDSSKQHLLYISKFPKYKDSWVQYYLCLSDLTYHLPQNICYDEMSLEEIKYSVDGIADKLRNSLVCSKHIPQRFISKHLSDAIILAEDIMTSQEKPAFQKYWDLINYCNQIKACMEQIAYRFDDKYIRILYEIDGSADY